MGYTFDEQGVRRIVATVRRVEQDPRSLTGKSIPIASGTSINWLPGYNNAGEEIPAYSCVVIGAKADKNGVQHNALTKPSTTFSTAFGLTVGLDISSGDNCGYHVESGFATYDTGTPAVGEVWGPKPGQFTLTRGYVGFICLGIIDATAKIMLAERTQSRSYLCKPNSSITKGSTGACTIWAGVSGSEAATTWTSVTARAKWAAVTSGKFCLLTWVNDGPYVSPLEC